MADDVGERAPLERVKLPSGQELVRRKNKKKDAAAAIGSLDEVAAKVRTRTEEPASQQYHTPGAAVPPDVDDPAARTLPTIEEIELTEEAFVVEPREPTATRQFRDAPEPPDVPDLSDKDQKLRTLEDLNAHFPFDGSGQYFIMVERQAPLSLEGISCAGRQRNITRRLTYDEFCHEYGGGAYVLTVYGPGKSRQRDTAGRIIPKALTKPVRFVVPHSRPGALAPNLFSAYEAEPEMAHEEQSLHDPVSPMARSLLSRRANTLPDARMLEAQLEHDRQMDQRDRDARREERVEKRREETSAIGAVKEASSESMQILREQLQASQEEIRELRAKGNGGGLGEALLLMEKMKGPDTSAQEISRLRAGYEEQLKNLRDQTADRVRDLDERHRRELAELATRVERDRDVMVASAARDRDDAVRRAEAEIERVVRQSSDLERRLLSERDQERERAQKEAERVEAAHRREIESIHNEHRRVLESMEKDHERDLQNIRDRASSERQLVESSNQLATRLEKTTLESDLRRVQGDLTQARAEIERLKAEVEKKGNLPKMLRETKQMAADLGMVEDDGGKAAESEDVDIKQVALKSFLSIAQNLPAIIGQVTEAVKTRSGGGGAPQQMRQLPGGPPMVGRPPQLAHGPVTAPMAIGPWMSEETEGMSVAPPAIMQGAYAQGPVVPAPPPVVSMPPPSMPPPQQPMPQPPPSMPPPQQMRPTTPSQAPQRRAPEHAELAPPPPAPEPAPAIQVSDEDIMKFAPDLEALLAESIQTGIAPAEQAERVLAQYPALRFVAPALTGEFIAEVLQRNDKSSSPLVRRDGQRFISQFRAAILEAA